MQLEQWLGANTAARIANINGCRGVLFDIFTTDGRDKIVFLPWYFFNELSDLRNELASLPNNPTAELFPCNDDGTVTI